MTVPKKEGTLVSYSFFLTGDTGVKAKKAFKERNGLDVEFVTGTGAPLIERIKTERRAGIPVASAFDTSVPLLMQAKMEGLTEAAGYLPEIQDTFWEKSPVLDKDGHVLSSAVQMVGPWVNTKTVKPAEEPKSWQELLRWKGKISMPDPDTTPSGPWLYYHLVKKNKILDDNYFRELGKMTILYPNNRIGAEAVAKGEVDVGASFTPASMSVFLQVGAPVKAIDMEEGVVGTRSAGVVFLSKSPQPNVARVFANWWFSKEGQLIFHEAMGMESLRKEVPNFVPSPGRLTPKNILWSSAEDDVETAVIQRDRTLKNLLAGK